MLGAMLEEERVKLCGPREAHQPGRVRRGLATPTASSRSEVAACAFVVRAFATSTAKK